MASATGSSKNDTALIREEMTLRWSRRWSLTARILAVNIFALIMLAGGVIYLDSFRDRLIEQRREEMRLQATVVAQLIGARSHDPNSIRRLVARYQTSRGTRLRVYDAEGHRMADSWQGPSRRFILRDPESEPWQKHAARTLDAAIESLGAASPLPRYAEPANDRRAAWPEAEEAAHRAPGLSAAVDQLRRAPDRTIIIAAAAPIPAPGAPHAVVHLTEDARDITRVVRSERFNSFIIFLGILLLSLLLSLFLARTIAQPLRMLAIAATRVRQGRAREVTVPRFALRRDEIGELARALSDMTHALRHRIDATEAFAADVAHELKNPLASLRSAVDGLGLIADPDLRAQLLDVVRDDVDRIDRLITDIAEASRLDAELSRTRFATVDIGGMTETLLRIYEQQGLPRGIRFAFARPDPGSAIALGDERRLAQVLRNLIDNAISFSPEEGLVRINLMRAQDRILLRVEDDGPGIPPDNLEDIFKRFYSARPSDEDFGKHSGLGLAISKAIVDAHDGQIAACNRMDNGRVLGARFTVDLPAAATTAP